MENVVASPGVDHESPQAGDREDRPPWEEDHEAFQPLEAGREELPVPSEVEVHPRLEAAREQDWAPALICPESPEMRRESSLRM